MLLETNFRLQGHPLAVGFGRVGMRAEVDEDGRRCCGVLARYGRDAVSIVRYASSTSPSTAAASVRCDLDHPNSVHAA